MKKTLVRAVALFSIVIALGVIGTLVVRAQTTIPPQRSMPNADYWPIATAQFVFIHANLGGM